MIILAIETSGLVASAAIMQDDRLVAEYTVNNRQTHSQTLLPMIDAIVRSADITMKDIDAVAISAGPGSFTGLRIGSATAKGFGLALEVPIIEVPTLAGLAYGLYGTGDGVVCPIMDAKRSEVYSGIYEFVSEDGTASDDRGVGTSKDGSEAGSENDCCEAGAGKAGHTLTLRSLAKESAGPLTDLIEKLNGIGRRVIFTGDAVPVYADMIEAQMKVPYSFAPAHLSRQRAAAVAALGSQMYPKGLTVSAADHAPVYLRMSQAEREKKEREEQRC